jgi:hypothetical protein
MSLARFVPFFALVSLAAFNVYAREVPARLTGMDLRTGQRSSFEVVGSAKVKATVVVFVSARCPCSASHEPVLKSLADRYGARGFEFVGIHSNTDEPTPEARKHFASSALPFSVFEDTDARWANDFGALKTPHAYVVSPEGKILFQGGVDDSRTAARASRHYLAEVLGALDQGLPAPIHEVRALGCIIRRK